MRFAESLVGDSAGEEGYIGKEIESIIEEFDFIIDEETGEVRDDDVLDIRIQDENIPMTDNTQKETGADNEEKNAIYAEHYNEIKERYLTAA